MPRQQAASEEYDERDHYDFDKDHRWDPPDRYEKDDD